MNVLLLGPDRGGLAAFLADQGEMVTRTEGPIDAEYIRASSAEVIVSYGYRHMISKEVLDAVGGRAINLHISYLPWNRGADPNVWSFLEDTPKGVTIHLVDEGLDTGDILWQESVDLEPGETLATSYAKLSDAVETLFRRHWEEFKLGEYRRVRQTGETSSHRRADLEGFRHLLRLGWDTPVHELQGKANAPDLEDGS